MRFHIGFSKRISIKKLIEIIGFLFIACLTFFGIYDTTHAWERIGYSNFIGMAHEYFDYDTNQPGGTQCSGLTTQNAFEYEQNKCLWYSNYSTNKYIISASKYIYPNNYYNFFNVATSRGYLTTYNDDKVYSDIYKFTFSSNTISTCPNDSTDLKSVNFKFRLDFSNYGNDFEFFNLSNFESDLLGVSMTAYDDTDPTNIIPYTNACTMDHHYAGIYQVYCNNIYYGNSNKPISKYSINIVNKSPFNDRYSNSTEEKFVNYHILLTYSGSGSSDYDYTLQYECNNEPPVFEPICEGTECIDDDPGGLGDIYNLIKGVYDTNLPGIDTNLTLLHLPKTFTDILLLPFDVVQAFVNNSYQCSPYELDFTSILSKWGNPSDTYVVRLPCMREVLSSKLGAIYTLVDALICFFLFYDISMHVINLISALTSGEDLFTYFFKPSKGSVKYVDSQTGEVINRG